MAASTSPLTVFSASDTPTDTDAAKPPNEAASDAPTESARMREPSTALTVTLSPVTPSPPSILPRTSTPIRLVADTPAPLPAMPRPAPAATAAEIDSTRASIDWADSAVTATSPPAVMPVSCA